MHIVNFTDLNFKNSKKDLEEDLVLNYNVKNQNIRIKTTIPTEEKIKLVSEVLSNSVDDTAGFFNPYRLKIVGTVVAMEYYSNINFGDDKYENIYDIYDILDDEGFSVILFTKTDFESLFKMLEKCAKSIVKYNNSIAGLLNNMKDNGSEVSQQFSDIIEKIKTDPELSNFMQNVMPNLG